MLLNEHIDKLITTAIIIIHVVLFSFFINNLQVGDLLYYQKVQDEIQFSDIVYTSENVGGYYEYYDYAIVKPKFDNDLINTDIYVQTGEIYNDLLSLNWKLEARKNLNTNECMISINIAKKMGIHIGDTLVISQKHYQVVDFLPKYKGFNNQKNRLGVILVSNIDVNIEEHDNQYMYFNFDYNATFSNSYYTRSSEYYKMENKGIYFVIFSLSNLFLILLTYSVSILKEKIRVLRKEKYGFLKLFWFCMNESFFIPTAVIISSYTIIYFSGEYALYGDLLNSEFVVFLLMHIICNLAVLTLYVLKNAYLAESW